MATMADELKCDWCGRAEDIDFCTVDGVCDENGNSIGHRRPALWRLRRKRKLKRRKQPWRTRRTTSLTGRKRTRRFAGDRSREAAPDEKKDRKPGSRQPALLALGERMPNELRVTFKGKEYLAAVNPDGTILVEGHEQPFNSPSPAGNAITGREVDGWTFWSYGKADGSLKKLDTLRKEKG